MITYKDCPECGARRIRSTVRLCEVCETCEKYESKSNAQWADLERIASLCGRTADEHPLQAVARVVRERDAARAQVKAWQAEELARRTERDEARADVGRLRSAYKRYGAAGVSEALKEISQRDAHPSDSTR
jgi:hypothetical protein